MIKNLFSANEQNNFEPHLSKPALVALVLSLVVFARFLIFFNAQQPTTQAADLTVANILAGINNERTLRNIPGLKTDARLSVAAQSKSDDMQTRHYFSHTDPEGNYVWPKIVAAGYEPYLTLGENLAIEFYNTESLVAAWMNSPTHRANIVNENYKDQGMGLAMGTPGRGEYYSAITNTFGALLTNKPSPAFPAPQPPQPETAGDSLSAEVKTPLPKPPPAAKPAEAPKSPPSPLPPKTPPPPAESTAQLNARAGEGSPEKIAYEIPETAPKLSGPTAEPQAVVGTKENFFQQNRKVSLGLASLLVILLLLDLKLLQKEKYPGLDKKLNNLSLLFLAIVLTAFLYWL